MHVVLPATREPFRPHSWAGAALRRILAAATIALVTLSALGVGRTYLWCAMMEQRVERCCCTPDRSGDEPGDDEGPGIQNGCCEEQAASTPAVGNVSANLLEVPAALPVTEAAPPVTLATTARVPSFDRLADPPGVRARPIRAGPASASDTCVRLQVFRC